jgi:ABC-type sugar transport system ATPase subunit
LSSDCLKMIGISKRFPGVQALDDVDFTLKRGEIHALVGENGAGKSTLMNILGGNVKADAGYMELNGKILDISCPIESLNKGIGFVHQESNLLENLTVLENIFLAREETKLGILNHQTMRDKIVEFQSIYGYQIDPDRYVSSFSIVEKQSVEIIRALICDPQILILDEPTAALDSNETERLFCILSQLQNKGVAIIYISHRIEEIFQISQRITVLKDGKVVGVRNTNCVDKDEIISMMVGRVLEDIYPNRKNHSIGKPVLSLRNVSIHKHIHEVSFDLHEGEILGLGGLEGHGQRELLRAIFGDIAFSGRSLFGCGNSYDKVGMRKRIHSGIGYVTHDRRGDGLFLNETVQKNIAIASLHLRNRLGFIDTNEEKKKVLEKIEQMSIKITDINQSITDLSGGNQQKVMLARWLLINPYVLLIDEPTKGVDVGARMSVYQIIDQLTKEGIGILLFTSDMMELIGLSDRILVFYEGKISGELKRGEATEERIMRAASGIRE